MTLGAVELSLRYRSLVEAALVHRALDFVDFDVVVMLSVRVFVRLSG